MSDTGEHPAVPEQPKEPTLPGVLWLLAGLIFKREALLVIGVAAMLLVAGGVSVVWAQDKFDGGVAPLKAELQKHTETEDRKIEALSARFDAAEERSAKRFEVLYNAVLQRREQPGAEELKQPVTDGGR